MQVKTTARWEATANRSTFACLNKRCGKVFATVDRNPSCPACGCVRVEWAAPQVAIRSETTTHNDKTLRGLADRFKLGDLGQRSGTHAGERAEPHLRQPPSGGRLYEPMPGFRVPWSNRPTAGFGNQSFAGVRAQAGAVRATVGAKPIPTEVRFADKKVPR